MTNPYVTRRTFTQYGDCAEAWVTSILFPDRVRYRHKKDAPWDGTCRQMYWEGDILYSYGGHFPIASWISLGTKHHDDPAQPRVGAFFLNFNCHGDLGSKGHSNTTRRHIRAVERALVQARAYLGDKYLQLSYACPNWIKQAVAGGQNSMELMLHGFAADIDQLANSRDRISTVTFPANRMLRSVLDEIACPFFNDALGHYKYGPMGDLVIKRIQSRLSHKLDRVMEIRDDIRKFLLDTSLPYNTEDDSTGASKTDGNVFSPVSPLLNETWGQVTFDRAATLVSRNFEKTPTLSYLDETGATDILRENNCSPIGFAVRIFMASQLRKLLISPISGSSLKAFLLAGATDILEHNAKLVRRVVGEQQRVRRNLKAVMGRAMKKTRQKHLATNHPYGDGNINRRLVVPVPIVHIQPASENLAPADPDQQEWIDMDRIAYR